MMTRILFLLIIAILPIGNAMAQKFDEFFCDTTLRIAYIFSGDVHKQYVALDDMSRSPRWYGKRQRLSEVPMEGNGQITVRDGQSHEVIYRNSFSTLFQEWLTYPEAKQSQKAFENVFLVPMPRRDVDVSIVLFDNHRDTIATATHNINPHDILIRHIGERDITPFSVLQQAADTSHCIHIAYIAEGYKASEMGTFLEDAHVATEALFAHEPFKSHRDCFNIIAVEAPSIDSGTSIPREGVWKETALGSHFDTFYSDRYLTTLHLKRLHDLLAGTPYEHIIVLVNTSEYGGGGILNSYNLSMTHHRMFRPVVVHEFGHSFAGLADEYAYEQEPLELYPLDIEPWEQNITSLVDFASKWQDLAPNATPLPDAATDGPDVGLYESAGYRLKGMYRPSKDCRMRTNENPEFCPVCQRAITRVIDFYTK